VPPIPAGRGSTLEALGNAIRAASPSPLLTSRRAEDVVLSVAPRATGAAPAPQRRSVEPVFRRPSLEPAGQRPAPEPALGRPSADVQQAAVFAPPPAPPFEWLDLEIIPPGRKPAPRGYAVYAQAPRPVPVPVLLIDTAA